MVFNFNKFLLLNESIYDLDYNNFKEKDILLIWGTPDFERYVDNFRQIAYQYDLELDDDVDADEIEEMPEYKEWFKTEIEYSFNDVKNELKDKVENDQITIWRVITVNSKWLEHFIKHGKHLGVYWSWDEHSAEAHWGYGFGKNIEVRFQCTVDERQVDWEQTVILNMHPDLGEEKEIRLVKNTRLKLDKLEIDNEEYDISKLKNRIFLS